MSKWIVTGNRCVPIHCEVEADSKEDAFAKASRIDPSLIKDGYDGDWDWDNAWEEEDDA